MKKIKTIKKSFYKKDGDNIVTPTLPFDFSIIAFHYAWHQVNMIEGKLIRPQNIYLGFSNLDAFVKVISPVLAGHFCVIDNPDDPDEWWMDFEESNLIFYSPGV